MAGMKDKYVARVGIDFEGLKDKPHVEPGEPIPEDVPASEIKELLENGDIEKA